MSLLLIFVNKIEIYGLILIKIDLFKRRHIQAFCTKYEIEFSIVFDF